MSTDPTTVEFPVPELPNDAAAVILEKLADAQTPGFQAEFDPDEAELAGAFVEDALNADDALESVDDLAEDADG
jgi:hypothetical protein